MTLVVVVGILREPTNKVCNKVLTAVFWKKRTWEHGNLDFLTNFFTIKDDSALSPHTLVEALTCQCVTSSPPGTVFQRLINWLVQQKACVLSVKGAQKSGVVNQLVATGV